MIAKLQGVEEPKKGIGLEYYYLNVKDEYRDGRLKIVSGCSCSKLTTSLVKETLNFQKLLTFFQQKY